VAQNPKRPPRAKPPFDDQDILRADDPRPQRVTQYPSTDTQRTNIRPHNPEMFMDVNADQEMQAQYDLSQSESQASFLYVERGPGQGQLIQVLDSAVVIGRSSISDLRIQHPSISRRHAEVRRDGVRLLVRDLGSQNGTFVNGQRIENEAELMLGSTLAIGNALVRLRGAVPRPVGARETPPTRTGPLRAAPKPVPAPVRKQVEEAEEPPRRFGWLVAVGVLCVLLSIGIVYLMFFSEPSPSIDASAPAIKVTTPLVKATKEEASAPAVDSKKQLIDEAIAKKMAATEKEKQAEAEKAAAAETVPASGSSASAPTAASARASPTGTASPRPSAQTKRVASDEDAEPAGPPQSAAQTQILAAYEKGNAAASLELAKKAGDKVLVDTLGKFLSAYNSATEAFDSGNGSTAVKQFTRALELDGQLSSGWGKYGGEIRKKLSGLYVTIGKQYAASGDSGSARKSFQASLRYDANNAQAKEALEKGSTTSAKPKSKAAANAKKSIDDAFDE
jgi:pSer/pThr/pTyr-binding forkhead associated (FHA) protein